MCNWLYNTFCIMPVNYIMAVNIRTIGTIYIDNDNDKITLTIDNNLYDKDIISDIIKMLSTNGFIINAHPQAEYKTIIRRRRLSNSTVFNISNELLKNILDILIQYESQLVVEIHYDNLV